MSLAVLTGASRGIGKSTALLLAQRGVELVLLGRPSPELEATRASLSVPCRVVHCDLADAATVGAAAREVLAHGVPDVLINNAAVIHRAAIEEQTDADFDHQLAVNLRAPFVLCRALVPAMKAAARGRLIQVASISAVVGTARSTVYNATKWGLVGFTKSLAEELTDTGVMTVAILPGSVDTTMLQGSGFSPRMSAEDVARTIVHYALDAPSAHNGGIVEMFGV